MTQHATLSGASPGERTTTDAYAELPAALLEELRAVLGEDAVITDPGVLMVYEADGLMSHRQRPRAVLMPADTAAVSAIVRILVRAGVPFVPRGAGTGLSGGALPLNGAVHITTSRMKQVLSIDPLNRRARVQPGVVNVRLSAEAAKHGLHYAPDPSSQTVCTIGGNVAENAGGPHCLKYGVTLNHITGLTVVLPTGEVVELTDRGGGGGGYDLLGLFIGSEGTFGIATEIEVRLTPNPDAVETVLALFPEVDQASRAVSSIIAEGMIPAALELIDRQALLAIEASAYAAGIPTDIGAALVIELDGPAAGLAEDAERAAALCAREGAVKVQRAADEAERQKLWYARKKAFGAMGRLAPDLLVQDACVPRSKLPEALRRCLDIAAAHNLRIANMFHAGDGNLHPNMVFDHRNAEEVDRVHHAAKEMMRACVELGGTITGEHGVGVDKRDYMHWIFSDTELQLLRDVRRVFDPLGLCNPHKVLPLDLAGGN